MNKIHIYLLIFTFTCLGISSITADTEKKKTKINFSLATLFKKNDKQTYRVKTPVAVAGVRGKASTKKKMVKQLAISLEKSYFDKKFYWTPVKVDCYIYKQSLKNLEKIGMFELKWGMNFFEITHFSNENISLVIAKNKDAKNQEVFSLNEIKGEPKHLILE